MGSCRKRKIQNDLPNVTKKQEILLKQFIKQWSKILNFVYLIMFQQLVTSKNSEIKQNKVAAPVGFGLAIPGF